MSNGQSTVLGGTQRSSGLPVVVKLTIAPGTAKSEAWFLEAWRAAGVPVPNVLRVDDTTDGREPDILVMKRVNGAPLSGFGHVSADLAKRIAGLQGRMHRAGGQGYGRPDREQPWQGVADTFSGEMAIEWERRLAPIAQHEMFRGQLRSRFLAATGCIESDREYEKGDVLTHSDLSTNNILLDEDGEIVITDPNCRITHIHRAAYLSDSGIREQVFDAALRLRTMLSISTWLKKGALGKAAQAVRLVGFS